MITRGIVLQPEQSIDVEPDALIYYDLSRYQNNGAMLGAGQPNAVREPSGLWVWEYDGVNDLITIPNNDAMRITGTTSIMFWCWPSSTLADVWMGLINNCEGGADLGNILVNSGTAVPLSQISIAGGATDRAGTALNFDTWNLFVYTYDGAFENLYTNTNPVNSFAKVGAIDTAGFDHFIGRGNSGLSRWWKGRIGKVKILSYALTAGQIIQSYENDKHWYGIYD